MTRSRVSLVCVTLLSLDVASARGDAPPATGARGSLTETELRMIYRPRTDPWLSASYAGGLMLAAGWLAGVIYTPVALFSLGHGDGSSSNPIPLTSIPLFGPVFELIQSGPVRGVGPNLFVVADGLLQWGGLTLVILGSVIRVPVARTGADVWLSPAASGTGISLGGRF